MDKKEEKLERITELEYQELLIENIEVYKEKLKEAELNLEDAYNSYTRLIYDKQKYRLEFYKEKNGVYIYTRHKRSIGFKK